MTKSTDDVSPYRYTLLDCLHILSTTHYRLGDMVRCHECSGEERSVIRIAETTGNYVVMCCSCDFSQAYRTAQRSAIQAGVRHQISKGENHRCVVEWIGDD